MVLANNEFKISDHSNGEITMKRKMALGVILFFTTSIITGCANIKDDSTRTKTEGTMIGAGVGAAVGAGLGALIGGKKGALLGAAAGTAVGAAGGFAYGNHVAGQKEKYTKEEEWLDACVAQARTANQDLTLYNDGVTKMIIDIKSQTADLKGKHKNAKNRQVKMKELQREVDQKLAATNTKLESAKKELEASRYVADDARKSQKNDYATTLDSEVEGLKANIAELEKRTNDLASLSASMSV